MPTITADTVDSAGHVLVQTSWADVPAAVYVRVTRIRSDTGEIAYLRPYVWPGTVSGYQHLSGGIAVFWDNEAPLDVAVSYTADALDASGNAIMVVDDDLLVRDTFTRTEASGWGTPTPTGPPWTITGAGAAALYSVVFGQGNLTVNAVNTNRGVGLLPLRATNLRLKTRLKLGTLTSTPSSPWWELAVRKMDASRYYAVRSFVTLDGGGVNEPGTAGNYVSTPDNAALDIVGDIDIAVWMTPATWTPAAAHALVSKWGAAPNRSYLLNLNTDGRLAMVWSADGSAVAGNVPSSVPLPLTQARMAVRATLDVDNGAGSNVVTFYYGPSISGPWTQLGGPIPTPGVTSIFSGNLPVEIGSHTGGTLSLAAAQIHAVEIRNGIGGTLVGAPYFNAAAAATNPLVDTPGRTWTMNGTAAIVDGVSDVTLNAVRVSGGETTLLNLWPQAVNISQADDMTVVVQLEGYRLRAKAWRTDLPEPSTWLIDVTDTSTAVPGPGWVDVALFSPLAPIAPASWTGLVDDLEIRTLDPIAGDVFDISTAAVTLDSLDGSWLRDPLRPCNDRRIVTCFPKQDPVCVPGQGIFFAGLGGEQYAANGDRMLPENAARPIPLVRNRSDAQATLTLVSRTFLDRDQLIETLAPGSPLLFSTLPAYGIPDRYMDVENDQVVRLHGDLRRQYTGFALPYAVVDSPAGTQQGRCGSRVMDLCDGGYGSWDDVTADGLTSTDLVLGVAGGVSLGYRTYAQVAATYASYTAAAASGQTYDTLDQGP